MNILIVGTGGREHALAWSLERSSSVGAVHVAPGNPGIAAIGTCHPVRADDPDGIQALARDLEIDLVIVGPEAPLVAGLGDHLRENGISVFGPSGRAARIEGSKAFAKDVMLAAGVPTAAAIDEARAPCVIKADGLAAGKGVFVCPTQAEADASLLKAQALGADVVIEELLEGPEVSVFAICDGTNALSLPPAQDYKRLLEDDLGPNTGGMGSFSPTNLLTTAQVREVIETVHKPVLVELSKRGRPFVGLLYAGLILTSSGMRVLEFNCRFGDPEVQSIVPCLGGNWPETLAAAANGDLGGATVDVDEGTAAVTVVLASGGYPEQAAAPVEIAGLDEAAANGAVVFHAGTGSRGGALIATGGRVLNVTGTGASVDEARAMAYDAIARIDFPGSQHRTDIAADLDIN
jgi:phosphoribosylamine--glycine ligase